LTWQLEAVTSIRRWLKNAFFHHIRDGTLAYLVTHTAIVELILSFLIEKVSHMRCSRFVRMLLLCFLNVLLAIFGLDLATSLARNSPAPANAQESADRGSQLPSKLLGVWTREWIRRPGIATQDPNAVQNSPQLVRYLQTPSFFGDMRLPVDRPDLSRATSFNDLTDEDLRMLAKQQGFVGYTTMVQGSGSAGPSQSTSGPVTVEWHRQMDFEPPTGNLDRGRLEFVSKVQMNENGLDGSYTEHWASITNGDDRFFVIYVKRQGRLNRMLLIAGDQFFYGQNRSKDLPAAPSFDSLITRASRTQMIDYLDFELSVGRIRGGSFPWEIQYSTLPWRERTPLEFVNSIRVNNSTSMVDLRIGDGETWAIPVNTLDPADLKLFFPGR